MSYQSFTYDINTIIILSLTLPPIKTQAILISGASFRTALFRAIGARMGKEHLFIVDLTAHDSLIIGSPLKKSGANPDESSAKTDIMSTCRIISQNKTISII